MTRAELLQKIIDAKLTNDETKEIIEFIEKLRGVK